MTSSDEKELQEILDRGHWAGRRFIPQPEDAARYHELIEERAADMYAEWLKREGRP